MEKSAPEDTSFHHTQVRPETSVFPEIELSDHFPATDGQSDSLAIHPPKLQFRNLEGFYSLFFSTYSVSWLFLAIRVLHSEPHRTTMPQPTAPKKQPSDNRRNA
jgi:hypothetical protein